MKIPYVEFPGGNNPLHFAHANGYPPAAYRSLLEKLSRYYRVLAMLARPLWPDASPNDLPDWSPLANDLSDFLDEHGLNALVGVGHSMGATTTLRLALHQPERFSAIVLIDPVLFPPWIIRQWEFIYRLGWEAHFHPLVRRAQRRKNTFQSREAMFDNYRKKSIFKRLSDDSLQDYVEALACPNPFGEYELCYKPDWEARIYATGTREVDMEFWRGLSDLKPPLLIIRGAKTHTFWRQTARLVKRYLPSTTICSIPDATHLVPLERPLKVYEAILDFLEHNQNHEHHS